MKLKNGIPRCVDGQDQGVSAGNFGSRRMEIARDQEPFTSILSCSDARLSAEIMFQWGLGDLCVLRVAGRSHF
ncbi:MAG: hypothetical protein P8L18_06895 [Verrucomicrobiota bacterium]|nr:hypothetical protein [Verrucomicrobiota bacterium]